MKKTTLLLAAIAIAALTSNAQDGGYVEMKMTSTRGATGNMKAYFSEVGQRSEFDMNVPQMQGGGMHYVSISTKDKPNIVVTLNDQNKTYTEKDMTNNKSADNETYTVKKVGEETMNNYKCIHSIVTDSHKNETTDMWTSKEVMYYEQYNKMSASNPRMGSSSREKAMKDAGVDGFPVKMVTKNKEGDFTIELVKMEKRNNEKSLFEIPAGYTKSEAANQNSMMNPADISKMSPEERMKYIEEMKKKYGGGN